LGTDLKLETVATRRFAFNKLAFKVALCVLLLLSPLLGSLVLWEKLAGLIALWIIGSTGLITYQATHYLIARRLELARFSLKCIRKRRFDNLEATRVPRKDRGSLFVQK